MVERTSDEADAIERFLSDYFPSHYLSQPQGTQQNVDWSAAVSETESAVIDRLIEAEKSEFANSKGTLGLVVDFLMIAEELSQADEWLSGFDPEITSADILDRYEQASVKSTLTIKHDGTRYAIRPVQNAVIDLFREDLKRTNFPRSCVGDC